MIENCTHFFVIVIVDSIATITVSINFSWNRKVKVEPCEKHAMRLGMCTYIHMYMYVYVHCTSRPFQQAAHLLYFNEVF